MGGNSKRSPGIGGDAAVVRQLQVELSLATRELDAGSNHSSVGLRSGGVVNSNIILSTKLVQTIKATIYLSGHLFRLAKVQRL